MMMSLPEFIILDVGHGICALIRDDDQTTIVDCAPGSTLIDTIQYLNIVEISNIIVSHADHDHIAGLITLLLNMELRIHHIFLNADSLKDTETWMDLRFALRDARKRNRTKIHIGLTTEQNGQLDMGKVNIEVLAPTPELAMSGVGGKDLQGNKLDSNSMSAVIGIIHQEHRVAILAGDIDEIGLASLIGDSADVTADILIFPHHGGKLGTRDKGNEEFAYALCSLVNPKIVIFSIDRNRFNNPREEIIKGARSAVPNMHILCTQLSKRCASQVPNSNFEHLAALPAKGRISNCCCGGTTLIRMNGNKTVIPPLFASHYKFVKSEVPNAMCLKSF